MQPQPPAVTCVASVLQEDDDLSRWKRYWCILKNLQLSCWLNQDDVDVTAPLVTIPVTKVTNTRVYVFIILNHLFQTVNELGSN